METNVLKLFLAVSFGLNVTFFYNFVMFPYCSEKSPQASLSKSQDRGIKLQAPSPMKINKEQRKDQCLLRKRNLIRGAYSEALQVREFVRKYFRKDLNLATKSALQEDYSKNYLPFSDIVRKLKFLVDDIHRESRNDLAILGDQVQERIRKLQNPSDCKTAKKLICKFPHCGFGCQLHYIGRCLLVALGTNRLMLVKYKSVHYKGFEKVFFPLTDACSTEELPKHAVEWNGELLTNYHNIPVISLSYHKRYPHTRFKAFAIPHNLEEKIKVLHDDPNSWWIGQIMRYVFRPKPWVTDKVQQIKRKLNLTRPYVSFHVRRTDKLHSEARYFNIEEYMQHVVNWYERDEEHARSYTRKVYVASDDLANVIPDARSKYPDYEFLYHAAHEDKPLKSMTQFVQDREEEAELISLVCDLMILSQSDYFVGTYSSNIGRLVTQLMHSSGDATFRSRSIDYRMFYYAGLPLTYRAIENFSGEKEDLFFSAGEMIVLNAMKECPLYKGIGRNEAGSHGSFPMHKVEKIFTTAQYLALNDTF
ncbi:unnamed protein product [Clavelina lepadiformis]|uniref:GT23 domain-containing protein n=1 Tax=Clavelina lepadiformis TaxID=159417 RepID=A0ABP0FWC9_CLALP